MQSTLIATAVLLALISASFTVNGSPLRLTCDPASPHRISTHMYDQLLDFTETRLGGDLTRHFSTYNFDGSVGLRDHQDACRPGGSDGRCRILTGDNLRRDGLHRRALCPWSYKVIVDSDRVPEVTVEASLDEGANPCTTEMGVDYECRPVMHVAQVLAVEGGTGSPCEYKLRFRPIKIGYTCAMRN